MNGNEDGKGLEGVQYPMARTRLEEMEEGE
jgi:hypothetical protein